MDYDTVLQQVGEMGPYQIIVCILLGLCTFYNAFNTLGMNLLGPHHDYVCDVTGGSGEISFLDLLQVSPIIPETGVVDSCRMLDLDWANTTVDEVRSWNRSLLETHPTVACNQWAFDADQYLNTFTSQWSAVCRNSFMRQIFTNTYQGGLLAGSFLSGQVADRIGRKNTLVVAALLSLILGVACVFDPEIYSFLVLRFLHAITIRTCELTSFVLISEILSSKWTAFAGIIIMFFYSLGGLTVAGIGFAISDFRWLQLSFLPLPLFMLSYHFLVPESPKWLLTKGRYDEVISIFKSMAKYNKKPYPEALVHQYMKQVESELQAKSEEKRVVSITRIFKPDLRKTTIITTIDWIALMLIYSAFTVSMNELAGSIYVNILLACSLEIPGYFASVFIIRHCGRKWPVVASLGLSALMNLIAAPLQLFPDLSLVVTILSLLCRAALSSVYGMFYIYSALLFPTEVRQIALGFTIAIGSAFGLAAPYIIGPVATVWTPLPSIIFGAIAFIAAIVTIFLADLQPESSENESPSDLRLSVCEDIPITNSAFRPAAACAPVCSITKLAADEEIAGDEFIKKNVTGIHFKDGKEEKGVIGKGQTNQAFIEDGYM